MTYKSLISVLFLVNCLSLSRAQSQVDSTFSVTRNGLEAKFPFKKFSKPEQLKTVPASLLPLYSFSAPQYVRIKSLLSSFVLMEGEYNQLLRNCHSIDSVHSSKENTLARELKLQEDRATNFQASYNSLLSVNTQLNDQLKKTEQLAVKEHRKRKLDSIIVGVLVLSAGIIIGETFH